MIYFLCFASRKKINSVRLYRSEAPLGCQRFLLVVPGLCVRPHRLSPRVIRFPVWTDLSLTCSFPHAYILYMCIHMSLFSVSDLWNSPPAVRLKIILSLSFIYLGTKTPTISSIKQTTVILSFTKVLLYRKINTVMSCQFIHNFGCWINSKKTETNMRQRLFSLLPLFVQLQISSSHEWD